MLNMAAFFYRYCSTPLCTVCLQSTALKTWRMIRFSFCTIVLVALASSDCQIDRPASVGMRDLRVAPFEIHSEHLLQLNLLIMIWISMCRPKDLLTIQKGGFTRSPSGMLLRKTFINLTSVMVKYLAESSSNSLLKKTGCLKVNTNIYFARRILSTSKREIQFFKSTGKPKKY